MKHIILLVAALSLTAALVAQDEQPVDQEVINETASISVAEIAG